MTSARRQFIRRRNKTLIRQSAALKAAEEERGCTCKPTFHLKGLGLESRHDRDCPRLTGHKPLKVAPQEALRDRIKERTSKLWLPKKSGDT